MDRITDDIFTDILLRLPAKNVAQLRCVSKPWNSLLSKPSFVKSHLKLSTINNGDLILVGYDPGTDELNLIYSLRPAESPNLELCNFSLSFPNEEWITGGINGLVCLRSFPFSIHIWNPSISLFRTLPTSPFSSFNCNNLVIVGFGFDSFTDDYKVVRLTNGSVRNELTGRLGWEWSKVEVFSLKMGCWKLIPDHIPSRIQSINDEEMSFVDGRLYCLGCISNPKSIDTVLWFDLAFETFGEFSLPDSRVGTDARLEELRGRLVLFSYTRCTHFEVWLMEYGCWLKHQVLGSPLVETIVRPLRFMWNGKLLLATEDDPLVCYDSKSAEVKKSGMRSIDRSSKLVLYVDSLVWFSSV